MIILPQFILHQYTLHHLLVLVVVIRNVASVHVMSLRVVHKDNFALLLSGKVKHIKKGILEYIHPLQKTFKLD